jgi:hypothetical protein
MVGAAGSNQTPKVTTTKFGFDALTGTVSITGNLVVSDKITLNSLKITLGTGAGGTAQGAESVAIGGFAGVDQGGYSVAVGSSAGGTGQGGEAVAVGSSAGSLNQGTYSVAIGSSAGSSGQGIGAVAIGQLAGLAAQGNNAIAIGTSAGESSQPANSIILNAAATALNATQAGLFINPVRSANATTNFLFYNTTTKEITYSNTNLEVLGNLTVYGNLYTPNLNVVLNDISSQFDNVTSVFTLRNGQDNVFNIVDSKDARVVVGGQTLSPYVTQLTWPWFVDYDSWRGFRIKSTAAGSVVIIYNSPAIGDQASITVINNSLTPQTRRYPFAPETIALGDE